MTAKSIVDIALDIIAERDGDGSRPVDIDYFNSRAVAYVNITLAEAAPVNSMLMGREIDFEPVSELTDEVACDPQVAYTALPYNLAALYMLAENDSRYTLFRALDENALLRAARVRRSVIRSITDVY